MTKASFQRRWTVNWLLIVMLLVALIIGFASGFFYERSRNNTPVAAPLAPGQPSTSICSCPNVPAGTQASQYCSC